MMKTQVRRFLGAPISCGLGGALEQPRTLLAWAWHLKPGIQHLFSGELLPDGF